MKSTKPLVPFIPPWLDDAELTPIQFRVYCDLVRRAGKNGKCFPAGRQIAETCCIKEDTVWTAIKCLVQIGLVRKLKKKFGKPNNYEVVFPIPPIEGVVDVDHSPRFGGLVLPRSGGGQLPRLRGEEVSPIKSNQLSLTKSDSNSTPDGADIEARSSTLLSLPDVLAKAQSIHESERRNRDSAIGIFPPDEIADWATSWHSNAIATGGQLNGSKIVNQVAALKGYLNRCAINQSRRFRELNQPTSDDSMIHHPTIK